MTEYPQSSPPAMEPEMPMHRYTYPVLPTRRNGGDSGFSSAVATQLLEQLAQQNQLLVDLLAAVNGLTASVLCQRP